MAKIIDITDKLDFTEKPKIKIKGKEFKVNDSAVTILKIIPKFDDVTPSAMYDIYETLFDEKTRKEIDSLNLNFSDFSKLITSAIELVVGTDDGDQGEAQTPDMT